MAKTSKTDEQRLKELQGRIARKSEVAKAKQDLTAARDRLKKLRKP